MYSFEIYSTNGWWQAQEQLDNSNLSSEDRDALNSACDEYRRTHTEEF